MFAVRLRALVWVFALICAMTFVAGCGDDDDDDDSGGDDDADDDTDDDTGDDDSPVLDVPPDETIDIPGLSGEARVAFDEYMIPYVFARTTEDAVKVMGYVQAMQRFFQMDFYRHFAQGRLTEIAGDVAIGVDIEQRVNFMAADGRSVFEHIDEAMDAELKTLLENYAEGVNAWLNARRAEPQPIGWPDEYGFFALQPDDVPDWTVIDTISFARYQTWDLSNSLYNEIYLTDWADALPGDLYDTMFTRAMATDTVVLDGAKSAAKSGAKSAGKSGTPSAPQRVLPEGYQGLRRVLESMRANAAFKPVSPNGEASNNWIVSPDINNGVGFLANDPHLSLSYPSVFHLAYMDTKELGAGDMRTWGAMFGGAPIVAIGANENLAWGETVAGFDVLDVYAETLVLDGGEPVAVEFDGGEIDLVKSTESFALPGGGEITQDIYVVPHHGPILPDSIDGTTAMSFRWTGHEPSQEPLAFRQLAVATNVDEGFAAIENFQVGAQNFVLQDTNGDLGYFPNARVPERSWAATHKPWFVLPGDGSAEWEGDIADMPQVKNPAKGWLVTANNDINGTLQSGDPTDGDHYWYFERDIGYRAQRITEMLTEQLAGDGITVESTQATQFTVQDNYARDLITATLDVLNSDMTDLSDDAVDMVGFWEDWTFETHSGLAGSDPNGAASDDADVLAAAVAAMGFAEYDIELRVATFGDEVTDAGYDYPYGWTETQVAILGLLDDESNDFWDDVSTVPVETRREIIVSAINDTVAAIAGWDEFDGAPIEDWLWGRKHHLMLGHVAFSAFGLPGFDLGPFAIPGSDNTPNVAGYDESNTDFETTSGPSLRIIHEFVDGEITTHVHYPGGQIPVTGDPNQQDMLANWLTGDYYEMPHAVQPILDATEYMMAFVSE
ncbi:MAG: penicillin acylase family protein [Deltaproteobacteria bacterium]|nr:penicillin acylase family protein [Deltaproteobacteria bacterium]